MTDKKSNGFLAKNPGKNDAVQKVLDEFAQISEWNIDFLQQFPNKTKELTTFAYEQGKLDHVELLEDVLSQACYEKDERGEEVFFSRALSAYADGLKFLVETGKYEYVYKSVGRMVKIRLKSQISKEGEKR